MDALPQVGEKYQHNMIGEVEVTRVQKLGRGYRVFYDWFAMDDGFMQNRNERLKDFQKATA